MENREVFRRKYPANLLVTLSIAFAIATFFVEKGDRGGIIFSVALCALFAAGYHIYANRAMSEETKNRAKTEFQLFGLSLKVTLIVLVLLALVVGQIYLGSKLLPKWGLDQSIGSIKFEDLLWLGAFLLSLIPTVFLEIIVGLYLWGSVSEGALDDILIKEISYQDSWASVLDKRGYVCEKSNIFRNIEINDLAFSSMEVNSQFNTDLNLCGQNVRVSVRDYFYDLAVGSAELKYDKNERTLNIRLALKIDKMANIYSASVTGSRIDVKFSFPTNRNDWIDSKRIGEPLKFNLYTVEVKPRR
jgi:hypothetical protein